MTSTPQTHQQSDGSARGVSYIMPVLNEEAYLKDAVTSVLSQSFSGAHELILALGPSTDHTNAIADDLAQADSRIRLVNNPAAHIPDGLNLAIDAAKFDTIVRVDAHSELSENYTSVALATLEATQSANVGGVMRAAGKTRLQSAIARAYNSRFGLGGGTYHADGKAGEAESAYLGVFRRDAVLSVGKFDPAIRRGEDWELNLRLREAGFRVWFTPELSVTYWPRAKWSHLAQQMSATGTWRAVLVRRYASKNPWRFFVPGALVLSTLLAALVAVLQLTGLLTGLPAALASVLYLAPASYVLLNGVISFTSPKTRGFGDRLLNMAVFATMHFSWGWGFLKGFFFGGRNTIDKSRR
jgi:glycosyltransferase involved in cell wall biosynthesis